MNAMKQILAATAMVLCALGVFAQTVTNDPWVLHPQNSYNNGVWASHYSCADDSITIELNSFWGAGDCGANSGLKDYRWDHVYLHSGVKLNNGAAERWQTDIAPKNKFAFLYYHDVVSEANYGIFQIRFKLADMYGLSEEEKNQATAIEFLVKNNDQNAWQKQCDGSNFYKIIHQFSAAFTALSKTNFYVGESVPLEFQSKIDGAANAGNSPTIALKQNGLALSDISSSAGTYTKTLSSLVAGSYAIAGQSKSEGGALRVDTVRFTMHAPQVTLSLNATSITDNGTDKVVITASIPAAAGVPVSIPLSITGGVAGTDYRLSSGSITIAANATSATDTLSSVAEGTVNGDKELTVNIGTVTGLAGVSFTLHNASAPTITIQDKEAGCIKPAAAMGADTTLCAGDYAVVRMTSTAETDVEYTLWDAATAGNPVAASLANGKFTTTNPLLASTTVYIQSYKSDNPVGCQYAATRSAAIAVTVNAIPNQPDIMINSATLCSGDTLRLSTSAVADSYAWSGPNAFSSTTQNPTLNGANELAAGSYTLTVKVNGCESPVATQAVVVNPKPAVPTLGSNSPVCVLDSSITLSGACATPGVSYSWSGPAGFSSTAQNPSFKLTSEYAQSGTYELTVSKNGCSSKAPTYVATGATACLSGVWESYPPYAAEDDTVSVYFNLDLAAQGSGTDHIGATARRLYIVNGLYTGVTPTASGLDLFESNEKWRFSNRFSLAGIFEMQLASEVNGQRRYYWRMNKPVKDFVYDNQQTGETWQGDETAEKYLLRIQGRGANGSDWEGLFPNKDVASMERMLHNFAVKIEVDTNVCASASLSGTVLKLVDGVKQGAKPATVTLTASGNPVTLTDNGDGSYSFTLDNVGTSDLQFSARAESPTGAVRTAQQAIHVYSAPTAILLSSIVAPGSCADLPFDVRVAGVDTSLYRYTLVDNADAAIPSAVALLHDTLCFTPASPPAAGSYTWKLVRSAKSHPAACSQSPATAFTFERYAAISFTNKLAAAPHCGATNGSIAVSVSRGAGAGDSFSYYLNKNLESATADSSYTFSNLSAGKYLVEVVNSTGCTLADSVAVPNPTGAPSDALVRTLATTRCNLSDGAVVVKKGQDGVLPLTVELYSGATLADTKSIAQVADSALFASLASGTYSVVVRGANSCDASFQNITVSKPANPLVQITRLSNPVCPGDSGSIRLDTISGLLPFTYEWKNAADQTVSISYSAVDTGSYTLLVTDANACSSTASVRIDAPANATPPMPAITANSSYCSGDTLKLKTAAVSGATYRWSGPNGFTSALQNPVIANSTTAASGSYSLSITVNTCPSASVVKNITVNARPTLALSSTSRTCAPNSGSITVNATGGTPFVNAMYSLQLNSGANVKQANGYAFSNLNAGSYTVLLTDSTGCSDTKSATVSSDTIRPATTANITPASAGQNNGSIELQVTAGTAPFSVSIGSDTRSNVALNAPVTFADLSAGSYSAQVTGSNGCNSTSDMLVGATTNAVAINASWLVHGDSLAVTLNTLGTGMSGTLAGYNGSDVYFWAGVVFKNNTEKYIPAQWEQVPPATLKMSKISAHTYRFGIASLQSFYSLSNAALDSVKGFKYIFRSGGDGSGGNILEGKNSGADFWEDIHSFRLDAWIHEQENRKVNNVYQYYVGDSVCLKLEKFVDEVKNGGKEYPVDILLSSSAVATIPASQEYSNGEHIVKLPLSTAVSSTTVQARGYSAGGAVCTSAQSHSLKVVAPVLTLSLSRSSVGRGDSIIVTAKIPVKAPAAVSVQLQVTGGVSGTDYTLSPAAITIAAGDTCATATLNVATAATATSLGISAGSISGPGGVAFTCSTTPVLSISANPVSVLLLAPADGATFTQGDSICITAQAANADTLIIYVNGLEVKRSPLASINYTVKNAAVGTHTILAVAKTSEGVQEQAQRSVVVNAWPQATVSIIRPAHGSVLRAGVSVAIAAQATNSDTLILWVNNVEKKREHSSSLSYTMSNVEAGLYNIKVLAKNRFNQALDQVSIVVNDSTPVVNPQPTVSILQPTNNATFSEGGSATVTVNLTNADSAVLKLDDAVVHRVGSTDAFSFTITNLTSGTHSISVKVFGPGGQSSEAQVSIVVNKATAVGKNEGDAMLKVYPNPAGKGSVRIEVDAMYSNTTIGVYSLAGVLLKSGTAASLSGKLDLPSGTYILMLQANGKQYAKKLVVR